MILSYSILFVSVAALLLAATNLYFILNNKKQSLPNSAAPQSNTLQLQAYERMAILVERISLNSLISRNNAYGVTASEMQIKMISDLKAEFEYNLSQQIYINKNVWKAISDFKDQNILIINKVASSLSPETKSIEFAKKIFEILNTQQNENIDRTILDLIRIETQKLL